MTTTPPLLLVAAYLFIGALIFSQQVLGQPSTGWIDKRFDAATEAKLNSLIVSVDWTKADLSQVLQDLEAKSRKVDPAHVGLHFKADIPADISKVKSHGYPIQRTVSILIENASLNDVLAYVCQQTNLVVRAHKGVVTLTLWDAEDREAERHAPPVTL
jgi:hypothetical protein